jgi:NTP pyrophosphatase (non-canonical NTP hydrolase)
VGSVFRNLYMIMKDKLIIVRAIDAHTFQPKVGVKFNGEILAVFVGDELMDREEMILSIKEKLDEPHHAEVDRAFKEIFTDSLTINDYQHKAIATAIYGAGYSIVYPTLGIAGEAGEVADKVKKILRDNNGEFTDEKKLEIAKEIGDVCWYIAALCRDLGFSMAEVCQMNLDKLASRQARNKISGSGDDR